jgi:formylglycine-generating enzyme required for sulfatase activity
MNRFGLYDMDGNAVQWCMDWFDKEQTGHVLRGASWSTRERGQLTLSRRDHSNSLGSGIGFRCVIAPAGANASTTSASPDKATKESPFINGLGMKFVPVPGTKVVFSIWDTRVQDYKAYAAVNKVDDSWTKQQKDGVPVSRESDYPVVGVSWDDAQGFNQWLTNKEIAEGKIPKGSKYRLATDEEWSIAVGLPTEEGTSPADRNGKNIVDYPWGKDWPPSKKVGNYADETFHEKAPKEAIDKTKDQPWIEGYDDGYATTSPVGSFPANAYGLYDMGGNVWQWCEDWHDASHEERERRGASLNVNDASVCCRRIAISSHPALATTIPASVVCWNCRRSRASTSATSPLAKRLSRPA